jgi:hypothetical protein
MVPEITVNVPFSGVCELGFDNGYATGVASRTGRPSWDHLPAQPSPRRPAMRQDRISILCLSENGRPCRLIAWLRRRLVRMSAQERGIST